MVALARGKAGGGTTKVWVDRLRQHGVGADGGSGTVPSSIGGGGIGMVEKVEAVLESD